MKVLKFLTTTTVLAATLIGTSVRADHYWDEPLKGFYVTANAGVNIMPGIKGSAGAATADVSLEIGERVGASVGYMVPVMKHTSVGLEFETGALVNTIKSISGVVPGSGFVTSSDVRGYYYQLPFLVNAVAVCHALPRWGFYAGVGGGGVYSRLHVQKVNGTTVDSDGDETDGAFQAMGGIKYQLFPSSEVGLAYKYLMVFVEGTSHVSNHAVEATYTFHF